jgi:hypothetical protein
VSLVLRQTQVPVRPPTSRMTSLELACSRGHSDDTAGRTGQAPAGFPERDGRKLSQNGVHVLYRKYDREGLKFCGVATTNPTPEYRFSQCHVTLATAQSLLEAHPKYFRRSCLCFTLSAVVGSGPPRPCVALASNPDFRAGRYF